MLPPRPTGLTFLIADTGGALARLTALEGFARAALVGVIPLIAYEALGSKEAVARTYLLAAIFTLFVTLNFGRLERLLHRRWVLTLSGVLLVVASVLMYTASGWVFALGIGLRSAAASLFTVCMSLYIMDYIQKHEFARTESRRMLLNGISWLLGPLVGIWLWEHTLPVSAFIASACAASLLVAYFWYLRLGDNPVLVAAKPRQAVHPLRLLPRYFSQKLLRIAYLITLSRGMFWVMVYVYGPIYAVEAGLPTWVGAALLSAGCAMLFLSPLIRRMAERFNTKNVLMLGLGVSGGCMLALGLLGGAKPWGLLFWWLGGLGASLVDVLGNIPFMRSVKPYERIEMTMVFSTWREMSELLAPLGISLVLLLFPFHVFYYTLGAFLLLAALAASSLPKRV